jgi:hypothetical protein
VFSVNQNVLVLLKTFAFQATYVAFLGVGLLASPHFMQLWVHNSRYFPSSPELMLSEAFRHSSLASSHPRS